MKYTEDMFEPVGTMPEIGDHCVLFKRCNGGVVGESFVCKSLGESGVNGKWGTWCWKDHDMNKIYYLGRILKRQPTHDGTVGLQDEDDEGGLSLVDEPESNLQLYRKIGTMWGAILHDWAKLAAQCDGPVPVPVDLVHHCEMASYMVEDLDDRDPQWLDAMEREIQINRHHREEAGKGML